MRTPQARAAAGSRRLGWIAVLLLACLSARPGLGEEEAGAAAPSREELARRAGRVREERKAWEAAQAAAEAQRTAALEALGIRGVARLGQHGDPGRCVDVVFIGDGFAAGDQEEYAGYVDEMAKVFDTPPFDTHVAHLNLHRVDLVSAQSGIKLDDNDVEPPLGGVVNPFVGGRLLRIDERKTIRTVRAAVPEVDYIIAVLNTFQKFRGSANTSLIVKLSTAKAHRRSIVVHEFGHNYIGLVDEYVDSKQSGRRTPPPTIERTINATLESNAYLAKWHHWNVPERVFRGALRGKPVQWEENVRCFEGGATFPDDVYRAEENCHMQRGRGKHFCRVCTEAMELGTYRFFEPLASVAPLAARLAVDRKSTTLFRLRPIPLQGDTDTLHVAWYLDGERLPDKKGKISSRKDAPAGSVECTYPLKGADLGDGTHELTAVLDIVTPRVHMDGGRLSSSFTWTIDVSAKGPALTAPGKRIALAGQPLGFEAKPAPGSAPGPWTLRNPPDGATYDGATGAFAWTPRAQDVGAWRLEFTRAGNLPAQDVAVVVTVKSAEKRRNQPPRALFHAPLEGREGEMLHARLLAYDPDGDHLAWSAEDLPPGAALDPDRGVLTWPVGLTQRGTYRLDVVVSDGSKRAKTTIPIVIRGAALFRGMFSGGMVRLADARELDIERAADRMLVGLHHPAPRVRLAQAAWLDEAPRQARLAESLRLLRDTHAETSALARKHLEAIFAEEAAWALPMFLDQMPARVWQFVDREAERVSIDASCAQALTWSATSKKQQKALQALRKDLEVIAAYNTWRRGQPPLPAVRDKKYR